MPITAPSFFAGQVREGCFFVMVWTKVEGDRLKRLIKSADWTQGGVSDTTGIKIATLERILSGATNPGQDRLAAICATIGVAVGLVFSGDDEADSELILVEAYEVEVSAGHGREALGEDAADTWGFPREFIEKNFGRNADLALVRVTGESMEPELRSGDMVMVDLKRSRPAEGLHVVRLGNQLLIKRIQVEGATIRLKSTNPAYDDQVITLEPEQEKFAVIGRAGWAGKLL